jgi:hypothetical protein
VIDSIIKSFAGADWLTKVNASLTLMTLKWFNGTIRRIIAGIPAQGSVMSAVQILCRGYR